MAFDCSPGICAVTAFTQHRKKHAEINLFMVNGVVVTLSYNKVLKNGIIFNVFLGELGIFFGKLRMFFDRLRTFLGELGIFFDKLRTFLRRTQHVFSRRPQRSSDRSGIFFDKLRTFFGRLRIFPGLLRKLKLVKIYF